MNEKMEKSLEGVLVNALRHCGRFRLSPHDFTGLPKEIRLGLASGMLDWLEAELEHISESGGGETVSRPSGSNDNVDALLLTSTQARAQTR